MSYDTSLSVFSNNGTIGQVSYLQNKQIYPPNKEINLFDYNIAREKEIRIREERIWALVG